ncbi:MAG: hypothetical protein IPL46_09130 [Saprospiraceae bacterium]|nr:hypothetical protein [Saprospiraceae bacterium]
MTRFQQITIAASVAGLLLLYFGFDTRSVKGKEEIAQLEKSGIAIDLQPLIESAKGKLSKFDLNEILVLEGQIGAVEGPDKITALKELSGKWYRLDKPYLAGHYAEQVAEEMSSGEAWSIAATTYLAGLSDSDELVRQGSLNKAIQGLENAISIDPETVQYRVNLALIYAERPPEDNPMKGVQMLLGLNEKHPDDVLVLNALARLAIKTGQWDKAQQRLERAEALEPENITTICLLAEIYEQLKDQRAQALRDKCELLTLKNRVCLAVKRKRHKIATHKRKKRLRKNRHKKKNR